MARKSFVFEFPRYYLSIDLQGCLNWEARDRTGAYKILLLYTSHDAYKEANCETEYKK